MIFFSKNTLLNTLPSSFLLLESICRNRTSSLSLSLWLQSPSFCSISHHLNIVTCCCSLNSRSSTIAYCTPSSYFWQNLFLINFLHKSHEKKKAYPQRMQHTVAKWDSEAWVRKRWRLVLEDWLGMKILQRILFFIIFLT